MHATNSPLFTLRPATEADYLWLWELKRLTMREYVEQTWGSWNDPAQEAFFRRTFDSRTVQLILVDEKPAGLLEVAPSDEDLFLANIQIHPEFQNRGLGRAVVRTVQESAALLQRAVRLQVLRVNHGAQRLYVRLGFLPVDETTTHVIMRWQPPRR